MLDQQDHIGALKLIRLSQGLLAEHGLLDKVFALKALDRQLSSLEDIIAEDLERALSAHLGDDTDQLRAYVQALIMLGPQVLRRALSRG